MSSTKLDKDLDNEEFLKNLFTDLDKINAEVRDGSEGIGALAGGGVGAAGSFAALYGLGITGLSGPGIMTGLAAAGGVVGGGAVAGVAVLAAPVAILAVGGYALMNHRKKQRVKALQDKVLAKAVGKQNELIRKLSKKADLSDAVVVELEARLDVMRQIIESIKKKQ